MVGGERQRAYRYGMTLLCVGALFNWLGMNDGSNSDPIRFIGYTCLASGALLICMAICFWANAGSSIHSRHTSQVRPGGLTSAQRDMVVSIVERGRMQREKPPDYDAVADLSPPPSYDDAIRLSPAYLIPATSHTISPEERAPEYNVACMVVNEIETPTRVSPESSEAATPAPESTNAVTNAAPENKCEDNPDSALTRVIRLSSRFLRRTLSNVDRRTNEEEVVQPVRRTTSVQDLKNA